MTSASPDIASWSRLREFALERLREAGEEPAMRSSHRAWCLDLAHRLEAGSPSPAFPALLDEAERELQNVREALGWALAQDDTPSRRRRTEPGRAPLAVLGYPRPGNGRPGMASSVPGPLVVSRVLVAPPP